MAPPRRLLETPRRLQGASDASWRHRGASEGASKRLSGFPMVLKVACLTPIDLGSITQTTCSRFGLAVPFMLFLGGSAQPEPYSTFGINKQENVKLLKRLIGLTRMQRKLSVGVLFKANGEVGKDTSVVLFLLGPSLLIPRCWL